MPYQRLARHVLDEWRLLERHLAVMNPASSEAEQLVAEAHQLRDEYRHLSGEAEPDHFPTPPPVPGEPSEPSWTNPPATLETTQTRPSPAAVEGIPVWPPKPGEFSG
jgi:hypothetical protein